MKPDVAVTDDLGGAGLPAASTGAPAATSWRHHGLGFSSPLALGRPAPAGTDPDVHVRVGAARAVPDDVPGPLVAQLVYPQAPGYAVYAVEGGHVFRFPGLCDFELSADGDLVTCLPGPECSDGLLQVLLAGAVTALLHTLRGRAVLHASAVELDGVTVAVTGRSGAGKSTVAAMLCSAGARLVADDVLALERDAERAWSTGLTHEVRLRPRATTVTELFSPPLPEPRGTADGRLAIAPPQASSEENPVSVVLLPRPAPGTTTVSLETVDPVAAFVRLAANARIPGLVPSPLARAYFETASLLAATTPVALAHVPLGPPFTASTAEALLEQAVALAREGPRP